MQQESRVAMNKEKQGGVTNAGECAVAQKFKNKLESIFLLLCVLLIVDSDQSDHDAIVGTVDMVGAAALLVCP